MFIVYEDDFYIGNIREDQVELLSQFKFSNNYKVSKISNLIEETLDNIANGDKIFNCSEDIEGTISIIETDKTEICFSSIGFWYIETDTSINTTLLGKNKEEVELFFKSSMEKLNKIETVSQDTLDEMFNNDRYEGKNIKLSSI